MILDEQTTLRALAKAVGVNERPCCCDVCWHTSALCPAVLTDLEHDVGEAIGEDLGFSLNHLRILTGPICASCWGTDGEIVAATIRETYYGYCAPGWFCERCHERASEGAWESHCSDFYGGSGPSDRDRWEAARNSGRRL
jgi:hypothetical protein